MTKTKEEMAKEYSHRFDKGNKFNTTNSGGAYFEELAFLAGYDARQAEVDVHKTLCSDYERKIHLLNSENIELRTELYEQCRLNGIGASRELALMAEIKELKKFKELAKGPLDAMNTYLWCVGVEKSRGKGVVSTGEALNDVAKAYYEFMDLVSKELKMENEKNVAREHDTESNGLCWCKPTLHYVDEITGASVWVHKTEEELNQ